MQPDAGGRPPGRWGLAATAATRQHPGTLLAAPASVARTTGAPGVRVAFDRAPDAALAAAVDARLRLWHATSPTWWPGPGDEVWLLADTPARILGGGVELALRPSAGRRGAWPWEADAPLALLAALLTPLGPARIEARLPG